MPFAVRCVYDKLYVSQNLLRPLQCMVSVCNFGMQHVTLVTGLGRPCHGVWALGRELFWKPWDGGCGWRQKVRIIHLEGFRKQGALALYIMSEWAHKALNMAALNLRVTAPP